MSRSKGADPTARAALYRQGIDDPLGLALAEMRPGEAQLIVAHLAYQVPVAVLARAQKAAMAPNLGNYDHVGFIRSVLTHGSRKLRETLNELGVTDEIDWSNSPAVQELGAKMRLDRQHPCKHCGEEKVQTVTPVGRRKCYCSNACKQAAYRYRRDNPAKVAAAHRDRSMGMMPCFAGVENRIPIEARFELIELVEAGAITVEQMRLSGREQISIAVRERVGYRWRCDSPLRRATCAALSQFEEEGVDISTVYLHGLGPESKITPYCLGLECRSLQAAIRCLEAHHGVEWMEIPRVSKTGPLIALRMRLRDRTMLSRRPRRPGQYFG